MGGDVFAVRVKRRNVQAGMNSRPEQRALIAISFLESLSE